MGGGFLTILLLSSIVVSVVTHLRTRKIWTLQSYTELLACHGEHREFIKRASMVGRLTYSLLVQHLTANDKNNLREVQRNIPIENCDFLSPHIVLIIGESYSKYHSSLYGYRLPTNPRLEVRRDRGELEVFTDVVSPYNNTVDAVRGILSFHSSDRLGYWTDRPLFPAVFKAAGYRTSIYDNQTPERVNDNNIWDLPFAALFFDEEVGPQLFSHVNAHRHPFDMQLLDNYAEDEHLEGPELCLFHLLGQHSIYRERYPKEFEYFTADSIARPDLSRGQRQIVAEYANATRYNDAVVDAILKLYEDKEAVVVYLSDHGEEIYDYRSFFMRSHQPQITPQIARYQFGIPFMIWMSDSYRERHRDIVGRIRRAADRPYMSDDLPHLLLDLAGIRVSWYDPSRSVIDERFAPRRRILRTGPYDYDQLMQELPVEEGD